MILLISILFAAPALANVQIQVQNVPNSDKVFVASTVDGKKIYAVNAGNVDIISDAQLSDYAANTSFTIGIETESMDQYCVTGTTKPLTQFFFNYLKTSPNIINMILNGRKHKGPLVCSAA